MRQHFEIGEPTLTRFLRLVAADALKIITLEIEFPRPC
jgi:hypothetical protein